MSSKKVKPSVDVTFSMKVKGNESKLPIFIEGENPGVVAKVAITFKGVEESSMNDNVSFQRQVQEQAQAFLKEYFEVIIEKGNTFKK